MKKTIAILMGFALAATTAFAQDAAVAPAVTVGGWGQMGYVFATQTGSGEATAATTPGWASGSRVGISVMGNSANAGFQLDLDSNGGGYVAPDLSGTTPSSVGLVQVGSNAKIWVKLNDMFKISMGKAKVSTIRGKIGDAGASGFNSAGDEDSIFARFAPARGVVLEVTPAEGVYLGAALDSADSVTTGAGITTITNRTASDAWTAIQVAGAYTIKDVGLFRVQYIGSKNNITAKYIQAAFAYTGTAGLVADIGAKVNINADIKEKTSVALGVTYAQDALSAKVRAKADFGTTGADTNTDFEAYGDFAYKFADPASGGLEVSFKEVTSLNTFQVMPYVSFGYSNAFAKLGFMYQTIMAPAPVAAVNTWAVPLFVEFWF